MSEQDKRPKDAPTTPADKPDEPFLKRWSRLKSGEGEAADAGEGTDALVESQADGDAPAIDPADLPDIDSLNKDSDYSVFMQEGVPDELRNLALRKLFASNPALAVLDGLNDYDEDYSALGIVAQTVRTAYKAGRGFIEDEDLVEIGDGEDESEAIDGGEDGGDAEDGEIEPGEAPAEIAADETTVDAPAGSSEEDARAADEDEATPTKSAERDGKPSA